MKKYGVFLLVLLISISLFGCIADSEVILTIKYTEDISFKAIGYTEEEAEKYIEDIPTEDGGLLRIYHLKDDSGRVSGKKLISNTSVSISEYNAEFDKKGRLIKEIDIEYTNPQTMNYREYNYKMFSSDVEINLIYRNGKTEIKNSITHKMQSKGNTITAAVNYISDGDIIYIGSIAVSEYDEQGNPVQLMD